MERISCGIMKTNLSKFPKVNLGRRNILTCQKWRKTAVKIFKKIWRWSWKSRIVFISFIIFVLKTTSMYFDLTYYYYTNLYLFLLWLNFQRNKSDRALVQFITNTIVTEPFLADLQWDFFQRVSGQLPPKKIAPRLELGFGLGLALKLGLGQFSSGTIVLEPFQR